MGRKPRILQTEYPYHVTIRTNNREFRFEQKKAVKYFAQALFEGSTKYGVKVHHFVLMSNHPHLIVWATEPNLHRFMQFVNSQVARRLNRATGRSGHLWGDRYRSTIISTDESYLNVIRYIYRNPVRAKMVKRAEEYEDSTLQFYAFGKPVGLFLQGDHLVVRYGEDRTSLGRFFLTLVSDKPSGLPETWIKEGLQHPFYGSSGFIQQMTQSYLN
jgi:putative transposase